jgi:intermediate peptidase
LLNLLFDVLDLFGRPKKALNPTHYSLSFARTDPSVASVGEFRTKRDARVLISCNFGRPPSAAAMRSTGGTIGTTSGRLSLHEMSTLFHEFGHAMHNVLSQTEFQHSGMANIKKMRSGSFLGICINFLSLFFRYS